MRLKPAGPVLLCLLQYGNGDFAPGIQYGDSGKWKCGHHLLLAHAYAVKKYRDSYQKQQGGKIGMALWSEWSEPWRPNQAGGEAISILYRAAESFEQLLC